MVGNVTVVVDGLDPALAERALQRVQRGVLSPLSARKFRLRTAPLLVLAI